MGTPEDVAKVNTQAFVDDVQVDMLEDWIDDSFRAVAPERRVELLDA